VRPANERKAILLLLTLSRKAVEAVALSVQSITNLASENKNRAENPDRNSGSVFVFAGYDHGKRKAVLMIILMF
jgi:hypothetical protein